MKFELKKVGNLTNNSNNRQEKLTKDESSLSGDDNLLNKKVTINHQRKNLFCKFFVVATAIILGNANWILLHLLFHKELGYGAIFLVTIVLIFFAIFLCLAIILIDKIYYLIGIFLFSSAFMAITFYQHLFELVIWLIVATLFFYLGLLRIKFEQRSRIKISIYFFLRNGIHLIAFAISLLMAFFVYFEMSELKISREAIEIEQLNFSPKITKWFLSNASTTLGSQELKLIANGITVGEYLKKELFKEGAAISDEKADEKQQNFSTNQFSFIPEETRSSLMNEIKLADGSQSQELVIEKVIDQFSYQVGRKVEPDEEMLVIIHELLVGRLNQMMNMRTDVLQNLPIGFAYAILFLTLFVFWVFRLPMIWTVSGLFFILVKLKLIEIKKELKMVESIE